MHRTNVYNEIYYKLLGVLVSLACHNSDYVWTGRRLHSQTDFNSRRWEGRGVKGAAPQQPVKEGGGRGTGMRRLEFDFAH